MRWEEEAKPPRNIKGEARISVGMSNIGGKGSFNSAIIFAISSLDTWRVLSIRTEDGRVVTRMGVLGLRVGLGGTVRLLWWSRPGKGVVGAGVGAEERETSGMLKLTASRSSCPVSPCPVFLSIVWITDFLSRELCSVCDVVV